MTTTNPVPSNDPTDLLFNAQKLDQVVNGSAQYYTDRLGVNRRTMIGISAAADVVLGGLGYAPPVAYASGISMTLTTQTVEYSGEIYAPKVASLPFTTSTWATDSAKFRLIQGVAATDLAASGGAGMIGYMPAGTGAVTTTVQSKLREFVSVFDFMTAAQIADVQSGAATLDVTAAIQLAATSLQNGQSLFFPAGDYIVNTGCVLFRGKTRIDIFGAGESTRIRPTGQGAGGVKVDYHTTFAIDQCSFVTVRDMVIESKGENYGNTDAYGGLAGGDPRTNAIINYGGCAVLVSRSDHVTLTNVQGRYCGSVGVFYLSSCEEVVVENCFANARSLGYAGFAIDNWAQSTIKTKRTYKVINCRVSKEDATYAAKGGIVSEGDEVTGRLINLDVIGGVYEDCYTGGNAPTIGSGITALETRLTVTGTVTKNCYVGINFGKRGGAVDYTWCRVNGAQFLNNGVTGMYLKVATATGGSDISLTNTKITTDATSAWAGVGAVTDQSVKVASGITVGGYQSGKLKVVGCDIDGGQYGIYAIDQASFEITGSEIVGSAAAIRTYGGGMLKANGNTMRVTSGDRVIGRETENYAASASYNLYTFVTNNLLECAADSTANYALVLGGNSALWAQTQVKNNAVPFGVISAGKGSATLYDVDPVMLQTTQRVVYNGLAGSNTFVEIDIPKEFLPSYAYAVGSDDVSRAVISQTTNSGGTRGRVRVVLAGDVRVNYNPTNNVRVTLMQ